MTVHLRHQNIGNDQVGAVLAKHFESLLAIACGQQLSHPTLDKLAKQCPNFFLVLDIKQAEIF